MDAMMASRPQHCQRDHRCSVPGNLCEGNALLGDKAFDADLLRQRIEAQGAAPNIPDKSNCKEMHCFSKSLYKERNCVERFFNKIKHFHRVATIKPASIRIWMRHNESMA